MANVANLGRVQGAGVFVSEESISALSATFSADSLSPTDIKPFEGDTIISASGYGYRVVSVGDTGYTCERKFKIEGAEGKSAYEVAVENGYEGTEEEWLESLKGEKGDDGKDGAPVAALTISRNGETVAVYDGTEEAVADISVPTTAADVDAIPVSEKGEAEGVATLDESGLVPASQLPTYYGTCSTAAATASKVVTLDEGSDFVLKKGVHVLVKFSYSNTAEMATLNVNGTGAKYVSNPYAPSNYTYCHWFSSSTCEFLYDGTYWILLTAAAWRYSDAASMTLINIQNQRDYVVSFYSSGGHWQRIWASGWKEMGGYAENGGSGTITVYFLNLTYFTDTNYTLMITPKRSSSSTTSTAIRELGYYDKQTSQFSVYASTNTNYEVGIDYYACGY